MVFLLVIGVIICGPAHAWKPDPWSKTDVALEVTWQALNLMDWHQT